MGKKIKNSKQGQNTNLNLKPTKSKLRRREDNTNAMKTKLKGLLTTKKSNTNVEPYNDTSDEKNSDYFTTIFNSKIIHMLIVYLNKNKRKLKDYKYDQETNFINKFVHLIKELRLNEIEVAYFTLLLDKLGWQFANINHWLYFYSLGIYTKKNITNEYESDELLNIKEELNEKYSKLVNEEKFEEFEKEGISTQEINQRFKELTKPINSFCRKNFINYSSIADKIIRLSQPYGEESNGNQLYIEKNLDEIEINNFKNNENNRLINNLLGNNLMNYNSNLGTMTMNVNGRQKYNNPNLKSIITDKFYNQANQFNNLYPNLVLTNIGGSNLSLIKQGSDNSFLSGIASSNNNFEG